MNYKEFVNKICVKCKNRQFYDDEDICNIRKNTSGQLQCINYREETKEKEQKR